MTLKEKFSQLRREGRKAFIAYVPFGFPDIKSTKNICLALEKGGADIIELGIPFSDPLADGRVIQKATTAAIEKGANTDNFLVELEKIQKSLTIPTVVMSYYNPIFKFGARKFFGKVKRAGSSGLIMVDLPLEEAAEYIKEARDLGLDTIFFVTPVTSNERMRKIVRNSRGFVYYISVTGITGPKDLNYSSLISHVKSVKKAAELPVCVGFGIHNREQVVKVGEFSDGVIVGSEIVRFIDKHYKDRDFLSKLTKHTKTLSGVVF